jgi:small subunit ribosomal protein S16
MLVIRLRRLGNTHNPHYRFVVQEKRSRVQGNAVDQIGHYHPADKTKGLVVDKERAEYWMKNGAQLSETVTNLFVRAGVLGKDAAIRTTAKKAVVVEPVVEKAAAVEAPEEVAVVEETTEEVVTEEVAAEEAPVDEVVEVTEEAPAEA